MAAPVVQNDTVPVPQAQHDFMPALFGLEYSTYGTQPKTFVLSFLGHMLLAILLVLLKYDNEPTLFTAPWKLAEGGTSPTVNERGGEELEIPSASVTRSLAVWAPAAKCCFASLEMFVITPSNGAGYVVFCNASAKRINVLKRKEKKIFDPL